MSLARSGVVTYALTCIGTTCTRPSPARLSSLSWPVSGILRVPRWLRAGDAKRYTACTNAMSEISIKELNDLRLGELEPHSHLEIIDLLPADSEFTPELYVVNGGDPGDWAYFFAYGGADSTVDGDPARTIARLKRAFCNLPQPAHNKNGFPNLFPNPHISTYTRGDRMLVNAYVHLDFPPSPDVLVRDAILPFTESFERLSRPDIRVFVCHASEDKPNARIIAAHLRELGTDVWFDEWEIRIGDSIVQKINSALDIATHLIILLSKNSVSKPWVLREFSAALMRQLRDKSIMVLPVRLDDSAPPPLLADIRYADARTGLPDALAQLDSALFADDSAV